MWHLEQLVQSLCDHDVKTTCNRCIHVSVSGLIKAQSLVAGDACLACFSAVRLRRAL